MRGYAWSGAGSGIIRVDVTSDGGRTWTTANLQQHSSSQRRGRCVWCAAGARTCPQALFCPQAGSALLEGLPLCRTSCRDTR